MKALRGGAETASCIRVLRLKKKKKSNKNSFNFPSASLSSPDSIEFNFGCNGYYFGMTLVDKAKTKSGKNSYCRLK